MHNFLGRNLGKVPGYETEAGLVKVSGATARWPFTDFAVPSLLLFLFFLLLLFFTHQLSEATIRATKLKFAQDV